MALAVTTFWRTQSGGSDATDTTGCSGGFDPGNANMATDLAADAGTGNTASPVVSSASYNFVAGDVGAWLFVKAGTNWLPGWYQIASVASNKATLTAGSGAAVSFTSLAPTTVAGVASVGTPSGGTWSVDYSQQNANQFHATDLVVDGTTNTKVTSVTHSFTKADVGNVLRITAGTGWTTGFYGISSVSAGAATLDRSPAATSTTGGSYVEGGAFASPGQAGAAHVGGNQLCFKGATYTVTSASTNVAGGCVSLATGLTANASRIIGFTSLLGDNGRATIVANGTITSFTLVVLADTSEVLNLLIDGNSRASSTGLSSTGHGVLAVNCKAQNCTARGITLSNATAVDCEVTGCTTTTYAFYVANAVGCSSHDNTVTGFLIGFGGALVRCVAYNNSGAGSDGFDFNGDSGSCINCVAYNNGRHGFYDGFVSTGMINLLVNCHSDSNGGRGYQSVSAFDSYYLINCSARNNTSGDYDNTKITASNVTGLIGNSSFSGSPFTNAAGNNFSLNNTAGAGALLRAAGIPGAIPGTSTTGYVDIGAAQHQDSGGGTVIVVEDD